MAGQGEPLAAEVPGARDEAEEAASGTRRALRFVVAFPGGESHCVEVARTDLVAALREEVEKAREVPPACVLKLFQSGRLLADDVAIAELDADSPVFGVLARETKLELLLQVCGSFAGYRDLLLGASVDPLDSNIRLVGPMPDILLVLEEMAGQPPLMKHLRRGEGGGTLEFYGDDGDLLLPSLDILPLLVSAGLEKFARATVRIELNSDAYNQGLGVVLEASPLMNSTADESGLPSWVYNGYGLSNDPKTRRNAVKFHPGMHGGQLRVEGKGGWSNRSMPFTPAAWTSSGKKLHALELTVGADGQNEVCFRGIEAGQEWRSAWTHQLTAGRHLPAVFAWLDMGSSSKPLYVGGISVRIHMQ